MRYNILGPLEVWDEGDRLALGGPQQRALLAVLLLHANRVVSVDRLIDHLWADRPPATARGLLQGCVAGLRRSLRAGRDGRLLTRAPGYLLEVQPGELDLDQVAELAEAASESTVDGSAAALDRAAKLLTEALSLWRGPALDGIDLELCRLEAVRLEERRLALLEERIEIDLRRGRHLTLVAELQALVRDHPLRERLWAQLMLALHGAHRQADALAAYRQLRETLVEQLGVEPGAPVREIHQMILSGADAPPPVAAVRAAPAQLPAAVAAFTGRDQYLERLDELLAARGAGMALGVISGAAGVGKTALAVHWAHLVRELFADGQLYVDLRGFAPTPPVWPTDALAALLQALGVPVDQIPAGQDEASGLYRTLLADRSVLVVLDNAASVEQVRPLLPGTAGCLVLVTSRDALGGLVARDGAGHVTLDVLDPGEASALLVRVLGAQRVRADPAAARELAVLCGHLPLALRIAAANLTLAPRRALAGYVAELDAENRLSLLAVDGDEQSAVRAAFDLSYRRLPADARRQFRLLGLVPGAHVTPGAAAALADTGTRTAARLLARLARAHLLEQRSGDRYGLHDLLRLYAGELVREEETEADRSVAVARLYAWYLSTTDAAGDLLYPHALRLPRPSHRPAVAAFRTPGRALDWLEAERANLVAAVATATVDGPRPAACLLADALRSYFQLRRYTAEWLAVAGDALTAARVEGDRRAESAARMSLGTAHRGFGDHQQALWHYAKALWLARRCGWREAEATNRGNLGIVWHKLGRLASAARQLQEALAIDRQLGRSGGEANDLSLLGKVCYQMGQLTEAEDHLTLALRLHRLLGNRHGQALSLTWLGEVRHKRGRLDEAIGSLTEAMQRYVEIGDRDGQAVIHTCLAEIECDRGRPEAAQQLAQVALALSRDTGDRLTEATALNMLGTAHVLLGRYADAIECYRRAEGLARDTATSRLEIEALIGLAEAYRLADQSTVDKAVACARRAAALAARSGYRLLEGRARTTLAAVELGGERSGPRLRRSHRVLEPG